MVLPAKGHVPEAKHFASDFCQVPFGFMNFFVVVVSVPSLPCFLEDKIY